MFSETQEFKKSKWRELRLLEELKEKWAEIKNTNWQVVEEVRQQLWIILDNQDRYE